MKSYLNGSHALISWRKLPEHVRTTDLDPRLHSTGVYFIGLFTDSSPTEVDIDNKDPNIIYIGEGLTISTRLKYLSKTLRVDGTAKEKTLHSGGVKLQEYFKGKPPFDHLYYSAISLGSIDQNAPAKAGHKQQAVRMEYHFLLNYLLTHSRLPHGNSELLIPKE